ncbi:GntR family transcriptional regulator [Rhizobium sp. PP-F2F-G38]|uniref:FadR family transcriptional regulator n=1 Tax=Ferranicluibacter rubi TaxID=2715133 RepID=A0AA44CDI9_9HYPH|nr:FCD domain-containing protein [Ferranicluibacter rubi]PYE31735.1 GntR family transcriptional regulator [Rhizobium sp. PP-WC-1G-195]PYE93625.1 GntR family transcriptional regulator [Rhizobium sp. PP-F2F-G38]TCP77978.1 GntR family transcriptional regulator [Rhizobium sp. PP-CC-2G-626]TCP99853.1 GntR family transcriptional regulator [Rhizobium sp. PP-F2F-G36]NHT78964.1 FadR family transcriptional regulator [Ferranicluibacter rubi]
MPDQDSKASAVDEVVGQIRGLIRERGLGVGDVLPSEVELAEMFASSRNTVREAFRTLKAYGIAESRQKLGAVLTDQHHNAMRDLFAFAMDVSTDAFQDIQGYRRLTELNLFDLLAVHLTAEKLGEIETVNSAILTASNAEAASEIDFKFHMLLVTAAGNRTLTETYGMLKPVIQRLMMAGKSRRSTLKSVFGEHQAIIEALRNKDRIGFSYHMDRHLSAGLVFIPNAVVSRDPKRK